MGQSQNILFWSLGRPQQRPEVEANQNTGPLHPGKLPFLTSLQPTWLSQFSLHPGGSSQLAQALNHPLQLTPHSFARSFNRHPQAPTVCQSSYKAQEIQGCQTQAAGQASLRRAEELSLCCSHSRHAPHEALSSENQGFSEASPWCRSIGSENLSFHLHYRIFFFFF